MYAVIKRSVNSEFYGLLFAKNHKVLAATETYKRKDSLKRMMANNFLYSKIIDKTKNKRK